MRKAWVIGLATLLGVVGLYQGGMVTVEHLQEPNFPAHARFHAAVGGLYLLALSAIALALAWGPYRWGGKGAGAVLVLTLTATPVGVLIAAGLVPEGAPPAWALWLATATLAVVLVIMLLMLWPVRLIGRRLD